MHNCNYETIDIEIDDLQNVAIVHCAAFQNSALTCLGTEATRRYYEWQLLGPHDSVAFGLDNNCELAGFCFGGVFNGSMSGFLARNKYYLASQLLCRPWLCLNPLIRNRIRLGLKSLRTISRTKTSDPPRGHRQQRSFGILSIAVDPVHQGSGLGNQLMARAETIAVERGFDAMNLSVDPGNSQAIRFYEKLGWSKVLDTSDWTGKMCKQL